MWTSDRTSGRSATLAHYAALDARVDVGQTNFTGGSYSALGRPSDPILVDLLDGLDPASCRRTGDKTADYFRPTFVVWQFAIEGMRCV
jgi:hypothetical protein